MKSLARRIIAVCIIAILVVSAAACTRSGNQGDPVDVSGSGSPAEPTPTLRPFDESTVVRITLTVDATSAYSHPGLPAEVKAQLDGNGLLMSAAQLTMPIGSKLSATFRVLDIYGIPVVSEETDDGVFITSIKGVANGSCGASSRWTLKINGETVESSIDDVELKSGDEVAIVYVCDASEPASTGMPTADPGSVSRETPAPSASGNPSGGKTAG